jgi:hypothetical protein
MSKVAAYWNIELNCICPNCDEYVNLLDFGIKNLSKAKNSTRKNMKFVKPTISDY